MAYNLIGASHGRLLLIRPEPTESSLGRFILGRRCRAFRPHWVQHTRTLKLRVNLNRACTRKSAGQCHKTVHLLAPAAISSSYALANA